MVFIKGVYTLAIAVLLVVLVIVGVEAFYPFPQYPDYPNSIEPPPPYESPEYPEWQQRWQELQEAYRQEAARHHKIIFFIVLPLGLVLSIGGTFIRRRLDVLGAGLILGGLGTMIYSITPYQLDSRLRFVGIAAALAVLVFVGYRVFRSRMTD